jgi:hypothetical protein
MRRAMDLQLSDRTGPEFRQAPRWYAGRGGVAEFLCKIANNRARKDAYAPRVENVKNRGDPPSRAVSAP